MKSKRESAIGFYVLLHKCTDIQMYLVWRYQVWGDVIARLVVRF